LGWQGDGAQFFVASSFSDPRSLNAAQVERVRLTAIEEYGNSRAMQEKT
jgi:hypothetical protein